MASLTFKFVISAILWGLGCAAPLEEKAENRSKTKGANLIVLVSQKKSDRFCGFDCLVLPPC